ncbi:MAG: DNA-3-methyladenine glycosylase I [Pseudomonadota bacterium]
MRSFADILEIAESRHGKDGVAARMQAPKPRDEIAAIPEDRWLSQFTRSVFQAGFNWQVIDKKWDGFEAAFHGFAIDRLAMMSDDLLDTLLKDERIVRNGAKIQSVRDNAVFLQGLRPKGGASQVFADWPAEDYIGLLALLKTDAARLGGTSGQYALRVMGVDSFILSNDVNARLIAEGVIDKPATSKKAMAAVQAAFNTWRAEAGRSLTEISRVLALSI